MASQSPESHGQVPKTVYKFVGKALDVPPEQRIRPKKFAHFDDPAIPRGYWYLTAGLTGAALGVGVLLGRLTLG